MSRLSFNNHLTATAQAPTAFDTAVEWVLIALLAFMPLAMGVVEAWSEAIVTAGAAVIAACIVFKHAMRREGKQVWSLAYIPIVLFILLTVLQLVSLTPPTLESVSPNTMILKARLLRDLPNGASLLHALTLSFYPLATRHDLRIVFIATVVFFAVVDGFRRADRIKRLLAWMAGVGGAVALLALLQDVSGTVKMYWIFALPVGSLAHSGPFVNKAHYSQFMLLSMGAAFGLLLISMAERREELTRLHRGQWAESDIFERLLQLMRPMWWTVAVLLLGGVTICLSMSRAGMVALFIASACTALMVGRLRVLRGAPWILALIGLAVFLALLSGGFDDVYARLATIANAPDPTSGRFEENRDILAAARLFPLLGTGLGTHAVIYPMFDRSSLPGALGYADNDYFQVLEEMGVVGLCLVLVFVGFVWKQYLRAATAKGPSVCLAVFGLGYGLLSVMIVSTTDYGQHLPSIACLTAISCGLLFNLAGMARSPEGATSRTPVAVKLRAHFDPLKLAIPLALIAAVGWALPGAFWAFRSEVYFERAKQIARLSADDAAQAGREYNQAVAAASMAVNCEPDNVQCRYWLNCYRWEAIRHSADPKTGVLKLGPGMVESLRNIVANFAQLRALCPTYGPGWAVGGQIKKFVLNDPTGGEDIRIGYELYPNHPGTSFIAGLAAASDGRWAESIDRFRRCIVRNDEAIKDVIDIYVDRFKRPDVAIALFQNDPRGLLELSRALRQAGGERGDRRRNLAAFTQAANLLRTRVAAPDSQPELLAWIASFFRQMKDNASAVDYYRRALSLKYEQVEWRVDFVRALADVGRTDDAMHEARICLRLRPKMEAAVELIKELSVRPSAMLIKQGKDGVLNERDS